MIEDLSSYCISRSQPRTLMTMKCALLSQYPFCRHCLYKCIYICIIQNDNTLVVLFIYVGVGSWGCIVRPSGFRHPDPLGLAASRCACGWEGIGTWLLVAELDSAISHSTERELLETTWADPYFSNSLEATVQPLKGLEGSNPLTVFRPSKSILKLT